MVQCAAPNYHRKDLPCYKQQNNKSPHSTTFFTSFVAKMLSTKDLNTLLNLLGEEEKSFETLATTFNRTFNKTDHFKVGCAIYYMLEDNLLQQSSHRLAAFYILHDLYKTEPISNNPFLLVFLDTLQKPIDPVEKQFLIFIINSSYPKDVCNCVLMCCLCELYKIQYISTSIYSY